MIALIKNVWEHWNDVLHKERRAEILKDLPHIDQEIQQELSMGPHDLLALQYFYFCMENKELIQATPEYQCEWLQKVTAARKRT